MEVTMAENKISGVREVERKIAEHQVQSAALGEAIDAAEARATALAADDLPEDESIAKQNDLA